MSQYFDIAFTPTVRARQQQHGHASHYPSGLPSPPEPLDDDAADFLVERDSVYVATVGEDGWPYVQHRGGPPGFIQRLGPATIGWLERPGNRQYITAGHLDANRRVAIIAVDYPNRQRVKLYGHATYDSSPSEAQLRAFGPSPGRYEALVTVEVLATDWNCPKLITPRYTATEVEKYVEPLHERIRELEALIANG